ncbi:glycosyltransferase [Sphingobacterium sp. HJSM2_6]|uniref:glycosyltransferase n=1 Tax=Sphingobacterium sp. HJSM2_6 TaxID=3366264 RepID=UPI003BD081A4
MTQGTIKNKIFFIVASLGAGGAERVFWLLAQRFDKSLYDITIVFLNSEDKCFSTDIDGVNFVDLKTRKASLSFFALYKFLKKEKPFAIFSTTGHINILVSLVSLFISVPNLIARASNIPDQMKKFDGRKTRFWNIFTRISYHRFDIIVCQSDEMMQSVIKEYKVNPGKLIVIPNPVLYTGLIKEEYHSPSKKRLIIVARLSKEKGIDRLLDIIKELPENYSLTIVGDGGLKGDILSKVELLKLNHRVVFMGQITNVAKIILEHDLMVLSSFTEGFPNVVLESLSVGIPVVTFRVGGLSGLLRNGFNGFIVEQGDLQGFKNQVLTACSKRWDFAAIKQDVYKRYALDKVAVEYQNLIV